MSLDRVRTWIGMERDTKEPLSVCRTECSLCDVLAVEAAEQMTNGGLGVHTGYVRYVLHPRHRGIPFAWSGVRTVSIPEQSLVTR